MSRYRVPSLLFRHLCHAPSRAPNGALPAESCNTCLRHASVRPSRHPLMFRRWISFAEREAELKLKLQAAKNNTAVPPSPPGGMGWYAQPMSPVPAEAPPKQNRQRSRTRRNFRLFLGLVLAWQCITVYEYYSNQWQLPVTKRRIYVDMEEGRRLLTETAYQQLETSMLSNSILLPQQSDHAKDLVGVFKRLISTPTVEAACQAWDARVGTIMPDKKDPSKPEHRIVPKSESAGLPWHVTLLDQVDTCVVQAAHGRHMLMSNGLLGHGGSESGVAVCIAKELASTICCHKLENLSLWRIRRSLAWPFIPLIAVFLMVTEAIGVTGWVEQTQRMIWYKHLRGQAIECDMITLRILWEAGYDINALSFYYWRQHHWKMQDLEETTKIFSSILARDVDLLPEHTQTEPNPDGRARYCEEAAQNMREKYGPQSKIWLNGSSPDGKPMEYSLIRRDGLIRNDLIPHYVEEGEGSDSEETE